MNGIVRIKGLSNIVLPAELRLLFAGHGTIVDAGVLADPLTGLGTGEGWIHMNSPGEAESAEAALNGREFMGRPLTVKVDTASDIS
jgi:RNA recognition motif-containing protein